MLRLIPSVKVLTETAGQLKKNTIFYNPDGLDPRLKAVLGKLPASDDGAPVTVTVNGTEGEGYTLDITADAVAIAADGPAGAFYAIQTLRQIFANGSVPCLHIEDKPDFSYRGFYHDVTRGKIPTVETVKKLIDDMAYYKLNSLQLYVEHVFEFDQTKDLQPYTGYLTGEEMEELDAYCKENFIEFIPSLSTFGHLYELLQQPKYHHLRVLDGFEPSSNFWNERMAHHTIDPTQDESIEVIKSLIDQYAPHFTSDYFNICCDETFDLQMHRDTEADKGQMYVDFVQKIIEHVKSKGKKVMMWADILQKHPETIGQMPEDTVFLNWNYSATPPEAKVLQFAELNRPQIVCPGTSSWSRFIENVDVEEKNISLLAEYGYKHGAIGVLNTNWGDWGNPCSIEMASYGMVLGAEKAWSAETKADEKFHSAADLLLYGKEGAFELLNTLSAAHAKCNWNSFARAYFAYRSGGECEIAPTEEALKEIVETCRTVLKQLDTPWGNDEYRQEMILSLKGLWAMAELAAKMAKYDLSPTADVKLWIAQYADTWRKKNKESELRNIVEMFTYLAEH